VSSSTLRIMTISEGDRMRPRQERYGGLRVDIEIMHRQGDKEGALGQRDAFGGVRHCVLQPASHNHDVIALALDERFAELGRNPTTPYSHREASGEDDVS
jgi:hypothetical protein